MIEDLAFASAAVVTLGSALAMTVTTHLVRTALWLLATLTGMAGLYATLAADYLAVSQLMVYVGGVTVLILFGALLTGGGDGPATPPPTRWPERLRSALLAGCLVGLLVAAWWPLASAPARQPIPPLDNVAGLGRLWLTDTGFLLPFYLVSVHLLAVMIAAAWLLARPPVRPPSTPLPPTPTP